MSGDAILNIPSNLSPHLNISFNPNYDNPPSPEKRNKSLLQ